MFLYKQVLNNATNVFNKNFNLNFFTSTSKHITLNEHFHDRDISLSHAKDNKIISCFGCPLLRRETRLVIVHTSFVPDNTLFYKKLVTRNRDLRLQKIRTLTGIDLKTVVSKIMKNELINSS